MTDPALLFIETERIARGISQADLSIDAGYNRHHWHQIITNRRVPSIIVVADYLKLLGYKIEIVKNAP